MATKIETSILTGWFKDRFGEDGSMLPMTEDYELLAKRISFDEDVLLGEKLTQPVRTAHSTGWTWAGGAATGTMFALADPNSPTIVEASWTSQEFVIRERTAWKVMRAAQTSKQAFGNLYDEVVEDMRESAMYAREMSLLHGGHTLGKIESGSGTGTSRDYVLTKADTNPGIWYKLHGALLDNVDTYGGTVANSNAAVTIAGVDLNSDGKVVLSVTGNATDLTAIDGDIAAGAYWIARGSNSNMMTGINGVAVATSYAGISTSTYPQWGAGSLNAASAGATFSQIMHAFKRRKLKSGKRTGTCILSDATMVDIADNITPLQRGDKSGGKFTLGADEVVYEAPGMRLEFLCHPLQHEGEALIVDFDQMTRIGSVDFTFDPTGHERYFEHVSGYAGAELMGYWDQTLKVDKPNTILRVTGLVNTH